MSDHIPYIFPYGNGDLQRVFQRRKTLPRLSKRVSRCRQNKIVNPNGGVKSEDLFSVAGELIVGRKKLPRWFYDKQVNFLSIHWICSSKKLYLPHNQVLEEDIFASQCLIARTAKISASQKFPAVRYALQYIS